ncbi:MAG: deoxyribose-phosphate aldolase [Elusimicrobia bacterium]|nr:deoxyribose-phosphate aldolase [Elusimicrobiota bacterium]
MNLAKYIDHTILKAVASKQDVTKLCAEAAEYGFASVCVNPFWVSFCADLLKGSGVKVCTVIGFPLGANTSRVKAFEAEQAIKEGADEVDMVINIGALKSGMLDVVKADIAAVREASKGKTLKVIIETSYLTEEEKKTVCKICAECGVDFVKTSTGFSDAGAKAEDVKLMAEASGLAVKASGGIRSKEDALKMIEAGASRLGTSSGVKIVAD